MALLPSSPPAVTAVVAPAGFGKTTVVASWVASLEIETTWLRLDEADQDPARFGRHLAEAVSQAVEGTLPGSISAALGAGATVAAANRATPLLNYLAARDHPLHVVLDDYHYAGSPGVD
ncbi:MAG: LuxR C-terminal-related transcriptional regulator, partial [Acidimicrobiales bacterium]